MYVSGEGSRYDPLFMQDAVDVKTSIDVAGMVSECAD